VQLQHYHSAIAMIAVQTDFFSQKHGVLDGDLAAVLKKSEKAVGTRRIAISVTGALNAYVSRLTVSKSDLK
jgi:hypothetical protein